jgi:hypothetical protein
MPGFEKPRLGALYLQTPCQPETDQINRLELKDLGLTVELEETCRDTEN